MSNQHHDKVKSNLGNTSRKTSGKTSDEVDTIVRQRHQRRLYGSRWFRVLLLSAIVQGALLTAAWYAVQTQRHHETGQTVALTPATDATVTVSATQTETAAPTPTRPTDITDRTDTPQAPNHITPTSAQPSERSTSDTPRRTDNSGAHTVRPADQHTAEASTKNATSPKSNATNSQTKPLPSIQPETTPLSTTTSASTSVAPQISASNGSTASNNHLLNVPIALQNISYRTQLSDGTNTIELPPAHLSSTHLGEQRYTIALSNGTSQAGAGNFGWYDTFLMTEHGPNPLEIGGGLYIKGSEHPLRAALGLNLHDDGQTWHWGKKANSGTRTHAYFLDRASLIVYVQGALRRNPPKGTAQWVLPIASDRAVREVAVQLSPISAPDGVDHCQPCVQAQVRAHLGEMNYWSAWYDGSRNWRPVMMKMGLGNGDERVLTLIAQ